MKNKSPKNKPTATDKKYIQDAIKKVRKGNVSPPKPTIDDLEGTLDAEPIKDNIDKAKGS